MLYHNQEISQRLVCPWLMPAETNARIAFRWFVVRGIDSVIRVVRGRGMFALIEGGDREVSCGIGSEVGEGADMVM